MVIFSLLRPLWINVARDILNTFGKVPDRKILLIMMLFLYRANLLVRTTTSTFS